LASELAGILHDEGAYVLAGRCDEDLGVPYQPFVEALRHYVTHAATPRLGRHGRELPRLVPELAQVVPGLPEPLRSDPETERYRLFDAVAAWVADVSTEMPMLLVFDDLQWAAKPTLLLLRHVLRSPEDVRLLVVATYRDTDIGRGHPLTKFLADARRVSGVERIPLVGLDARGVAAFVEQAVGHQLDETGEALARAVWRETEGNAFFVAEVLRHLSESGAFEQRDGRWSTTAALDELGIPEGVRDVVGRRLSRLSEDANRVLATASVVGLEFEPAVVEAVGGVGEDVVLSSLEEAVASRLVVEVREPSRGAASLMPSSGPPSTTS
jgi:predicted ATPase